MVYLKNVNKDRVEFFTGLVKRNMKEHTKKTNKKSLLETVKRNKEGAMDNCEMDMNINLRMTFLIIFNLSKISPVNVMNN